MARIRGVSAAGRVARLRGMEELLLAWYSQNERDLPWRHTQDPYAILVSEVMLQQSPTWCHSTPEIPVTMRNCEVAGASTIALHRAEFQPNVRTVFAAHGRRNSLSCVLSTPPRDPGGLALGI